MYLYVTISMCHITKKLISKQFQFNFINLVYNLYL